MDDLLVHIVRVTATYLRLEPACQAIESCWQGHSLTDCENEDCTDDPGSAYPAF